MDIWKLIVGASVVIGIAAGIAQLLDYRQKQQGQNIHATPDLRQRGIAKWLRPGRKNDRQILSTYLQQEREDIFSTIASGSTTLLVGDIVASGELFIPPPWANYLGAVGTEELIEHLINAVSQTKRTLLLGDPGQGKTTILKRVFTVMVEHFLKGSSDLVPLYIPLRDISYSTTGSDGTLLWLWNHLHSKPQNPFPLSSEDFTSLVRNRHIVFLFDGFDEMKGELSQRSINERAASDIFLYPTVLSCRTNFYELYLSASAVQEQYLEKIVLLPLEFFTDSVRQYIAAFCGKKGNVAPDKVIRTIAESQELLDLARRSLLLVMVLDIFTDSQEMLEIEWSMAKLYEAYTEKWLSNEARKPSSVLRWHEKSKLMEEVAWSTYQAKTPSAYAYGVFYQSVTFTGTEVSDILQPYASRYQHIPFAQLVDDICLRTFLIGSYRDKYYFVHKSFQEYYVAKHIFESMRRGVEHAAQTLRELVPVEVATFLKDVLGAKDLPKPEKELIVDNLTQTYLQSSGNDDYHLVIVRQHAGYYLACLGTQKAVRFLEQVYEQEPNKWVQRGIMVGLFLFCGRADMLDRYIDILHKDPEAASINIGYHLVYYGDQSLEEGYDD